MTNKSTETAGDSYTTRDREALGRHSYLGLLRYRDHDAGYCRVCALVFNIICPRCKVNSGKHGQHIEPLFRVEHPIEVIHLENQVWIATECSKCSFRFRVLVH